MKNRVATFKGTVMLQTWYAVVVAVVFNKILLQHKLQHLSKNHEQKLQKEVRAHRAWETKWGLFTTYGSLVL